MNAESFPVAQLCVNTLLATKVTLTTLPPSCADCLKMWDLLEPSRPANTRNGIALPLLCSAPTVCHDLLFSQQGVL
jgi:hypothetical protein